MALIKNKAEPLAESEERSRPANSSDYSWKRAEFRLIKLREGHVRTEKAETRGEVVGRRWRKDRQKVVGIECLALQCFLRYLDTQEGSCLVLKPVILHFFQPNEPFEVAF